MRNPVVTDSAPRPAGPYTQAIRCGDYVFVSGQGPFEPGTGRLRGNIIEEQTRKTLENVRAILAASGASMDDIVKVSVLLTDTSLFGRMNRVYEEYFAEPYPARVTCGASLANPNMLIEIDAIAYLGK